MRVYEPAVECADAGTLRRLQDAGVAGVVRRGGASALYRDLWRTTEVDPAAVRSVDDLNRLPYLTSGALRQAWAAHPGDAVLCDPDVRTWFATSGTTGAPKWTPYGPVEIAWLQRTALRGFYMCTRGEPDMRCLVFATPAPFISDGAGYFNLFGQIEQGIRVEYVLTSYSVEEARTALGLVTGRRPDAIIAFPSIALRLAEMISSEAPAAARAALREAPSLRALAGYLATRLMTMTARHVLGPRFGIFAGEPLAPFRDPLVRAYGLEPFELYAFTEFPCFHLDCGAHDGMHLWADTGAAEIILQADLEREEREGLTPAAIPLLDAPPGATGELVVTSFTAALPLIRYRTSDVVHLVATDRCSCGRTHPRVRILGRRDDLINMGLIRFSTVELERRLQVLAGDGGLTNWQLHIARDGYKPRPMLLIVAHPTADHVRLAGDVRRALLDIPVLRAGYEAGIVLEPHIQIVAHIVDSQTWSGKPRRVVYRDGAGS